MVFHKIAVDLLALGALVEGVERSTLKIALRIVDDQKRAIGGNGVDLLQIQGIHAQAALDEQVVKGGALEALFTRGVFGVEDGFAVPRDEVGDLLRAQKRENERGHLILAVEGPIGVVRRRPKAVGRGDAVGIAVRNDDIGRRDGGERGRLIGGDGVGLVGHVDRFHLKALEAVFQLQRHKINGAQDGGLRQAIGVGAEENADLLLAELILVKQGLALLEHTVGERIKPLGSGINIDLSLPDEVGCPEIEDKGKRQHQHRQNGKGAPPSFGCEER